jgi:hypothetical protein
VLPFLRSAAAGAGRVADMNQVGAGPGGPGERDTGQA